METFPALLAICAENSPVTGEFPSQRPVTRSFDVFLDLRLNKRLSNNFVLNIFYNEKVPLHRFCARIVKFKWKMSVKCTWIRSRFLLMAEQDEKRPGTGFINFKTIVYLFSNVLLLTPLQNGPLWTYKAIFIQDNAFEYFVCKLKTCVAYVTSFSLANILLSHRLKTAYRITV